MSALLTVCRKEILETLRERRTLVSLLLGPLFGPILFAVMINMTVSRNLTSLDEVLDVPILGAEHAPNLVAFLRARSIAPIEDHDIENVEQAAELVATGEYDVVLVIDEAFGKDFGTDRAARVALVFDRSKNRAREPRRPAARRRRRLWATDRRAAARRERRRPESAAAARRRRARRLDAGEPLGADARRADVFPAVRDVDGRPASRDRHDGRASASANRSSRC